MSTGGRVCRPCITAFWTLELPSLGAKPLLFKRSCGAFRLMWHEGIVWCMRENVEGKVECVCVWACVRALLCMWHGRGTSVKGPLGPDVWLPLTVRSRRGWSGAGPTPSPPFPRTKAIAQLKDVNSAAFVPKAQRHAEWEIWPLPKVRLCFWTPLAVSGNSGGKKVTERIGWSGCESAWGIGVCHDGWSAQVGVWETEGATVRREPLRLCVLKFEHNKLKTVCFSADNEASLFLILTVMLLKIGRKLNV